jgi:hypothetical protein
VTVPVQCRCSGPTNPNPAYTTIRNYKSDDLESLQLLAGDAWSEIIDAKGICVGGEGLDHPCDKKFVATPPAKLRPRRIRVPSVDNDYLPRHSYPQRGEYGRDLHGMALDATLLCHRVC